MNEFEVLWLNRLDQFDSVSIDVVIKNTNGPIPEARIAKNYQMPADAVDDNFLQDESIKEIERIINEWNAENPII